MSEQLKYTFIGTASKESVLEMIENLTKEGFSELKCNFENLENHGSFNFLEFPNEIPDKYIDEDYPESIINFSLQNKNVSIFVKRYNSEDYPDLFGFVGNGHIVEFLTDSYGNSYIPSQEIRNIYKTIGTKEKSLEKILHLQTTIDFFLENEYNRQQNLLKIM